MKKILILALAALTFASLLCGCGSNAAVSSESIYEKISSLNISELSKQELLYAETLGMPMEKVSQETLSCAEFAELLDWCIGYAMPDKTDEWKSLYPVFRSNGERIRRIDAMAALYLASELAGGDYAGNQLDVWHTIQSINLDWNSGDTELTNQLFGDAVNRGYYCETIGDCSLNAAGYYYNLARRSSFSGQNPFPLDTEVCSYLLEKPLSYADGILAVFRLICSTDAVHFERELTEEELLYISLAEERRKEIDCAVMDISAEMTGKTYYVSNNGSDSNNGLTAETAWATPKYALEQPLAPGDAVLLERGSEWTVEPSDSFGLTSSAYVIPEGVTLGAFGTGEKPILQGAFAEANDSDFWEIELEEGDRRIWKATKTVYYCPIIVFNNGESYASPVMPGVDEDGRYRMNDGAPFSVSDGLTKNLQFCCLLDLSETGAHVDIENSAIKGELYLRCDSGNPAEVFNTISIPQTACGLALRTDATINGIELRYFSCNGAVMDGYDGFHSQSVENCEVGWCGGLLKAYSDNGNSVFDPFSAGGALQISSTEVSVTNNYFHDCGPFTLIVAFHNNPDSPSSCILQFDDIYVAGNLIERCGSGIHMGDYATMDISDTYGFLSDFLFENNMVMDSGFGWVGEMLSSQRGSADATFSSFECADSASDNDGIYLRNNVFYKSAYALLSLTEYRLNGTEKVNALPVLTGNTYIQYATRPLLQKNRYTEIYYPSEKNMTEVLGDESGTLIVIE